MRGKGMENNCKFCSWVEEIKTRNKEAKNQCKEANNDFFEKYELHYFAQLATKLYEKETQCYVNDAHFKYTKLNYCPCCGRKFEE